MMCLCKIMGILAYYVSHIVHLCSICDLHVMCCAPVSYIKGADFIKDIFISSSSDSYAFINFYYIICTGLVTLPIMQVSNLV